LTDKILIDCLQRGDPKALDSLFSFYKDKVFNTALSYLQNPEDAEELTQDVFVEIYNSATKFKGESSLNTWIYRITVNKALDILKWRKRKKRFAVITSIFGRSDDHREFEIPDFIHPGLEAELKERSAILFKAVDSLPENQKTAFILCKLENLSYKEISEVLKTTVPAVESLLSRAKQNLKRILQDKINDL
jgi:RNA polymerase sigma-70 factor (ECF subfamily)